MGAGSQELTDRAKLLISERRYQEAVRACRRALLSKPDQVEMRLLLGEALLALERYDEVRIEMMALARRAPDNAAVHRLLGEAYLRDHRPTQAIEALRRALELDPSDEVAEELLKEASDETAPVSTTIERWFAEEAEPTVETGSPHNWEDPTATARPATPPLIGDEPSVQIDPSLTDPHSVEPRTNPQQFTPERRSPPVAPPPRSLGLSAEVAPPLPAPGPHSDGLVLPPGQPSPFALPPLDGTEEPEPLSAIATSTRQQPMPPAHKHIDDFELLASDEVEELEAEPTRALASERPVSPRIRELDEDFDELPTHAIDIKGIEAEATRAHVADPPRPLPPAPAAPPLLYALEPDSDNATRAIGLDEPEPPTRAHMSVAELDRAERVILGASQSEDLPTATAEPPRRVAEEPTPPLPRSSYKDKEDASSHTARVRARSSSRLGLYVGIGVVLLFGLVGGLFAIGRYMSVTELEEIRTAAGEAGDSGRRSEIESVLERLEGTDDRELQALRARLLATLLLEHAQLERREEAEHLVDSLSVSGSYNDAQIARAFLFLAEERPADALQAIRSLEVLDDQIPEAFRARAMALASEGEWVDAAAAAHRAFEVRPSSPRHLALHALMMHRTNNTAGARTLLEGFTGVQSQPALRTTLARILLESGADPERAAEVEARAVIEELPTLATPYDLAWAHLVRAYYEADTGNVAAAEEDARAAAEHTPPGDEAFGMRLAETFLMAGFAEEAETQLHGLPDAAIDRPGRALLSARIALERGNLNVAESSIAEAGDGVRQNLIRARIMEERGDVERARPLYEQAVSDPGPEGRRARVRLAAMEFAAGNPQGTIQYLESRQPEAVDDPELIPLLARAYIAQDRPEDARSILEAALSRRPAAAELLAAQGELLLAEGHPDQAIEPLRRVVRVHPHDAEAQANLGQAAFLTGAADEARTAWTAALEREPSQPLALIGMARLAMQERDYADVEQRLNALEGTTHDEQAAAELRAEMHVRRGDGQSAIQAVTELTRRFADDALIWTALGELQVQAESDPAATRSLERALELDPDRPEALLALSLVQLRRTSGSAARRSVDTATRVAHERGVATPRLEARTKVGLARIEFEDGDWATVTRLANEAIQLDPHVSGAHLLLATMAMEGRGGSNAVEELRLAVAGDAPAPEAVAQLALQLPSSASDEICQLARRYLAVAPDGFDAPEIRRRAAQCH